MVSVFASVAGMVNISLKGTLKRMRVCTDWEKNKLENRRCDHRLCDRA